MLEQCDDLVVVVDGCESADSVNACTRQRITRPIRMRGGVATRNSASHERPREDWITIAAPPIVSKETFALAQERLRANKAYAPRRTITPSAVQGLVSCSKCGYALYRTSTRSTARKIYYYRCLGSDAYRRLGKFICDSKPVRQDLLDEVVWTEVVRLLEDPQLIQSEIADGSPPHARAIRPNDVRMLSGASSFVSARASIACSPPIKRVFCRWMNYASACRNCGGREHADNTELQAIVDQLVDRQTYLRLAENADHVPHSPALVVGCARDVTERQRVLRLLGQRIFSSAMTRSSSGTASLYPQFLVRARRPDAQTPPYAD